MLTQLCLTSPRVYLANVLTSIVHDDAMPGALRGRIALFFITVKSSNIKYDFSCRLYLQNRLIIAAGSGQKKQHFCIVCTVYSCTVLYRSH